MKQPEYMYQLAPQHQDKTIQNADNYFTTNNLNVSEWRVLYIYIFPLSQNMFLHCMCKIEKYKPNKTLPVPVPKNRPVRQ
jgi:hypothetical protein